MPYDNYGHLPDGADDATGKSTEESLFMNLLTRFRAWLSRDEYEPTPPETQEASEEEPEERYSAEDMEAYAESVYQERQRRARTPHPGQKFRPLLMDFADDQCSALLVVNGVKRKVAVRCPWHDESSSPEMAHDG